MYEILRIHSTLSTFWWILLGLFFVIYIVLDGADLGAGVFSLLLNNEDDRAAIMSSMAGTWDANETWLVVAGGVIFGAFPLVYGSTFNYLMIPLMFALWGIISRAVAFEFHVHAKSSRKFWGFMFGLGSLVAAFFAGIALGATLLGFPMGTGNAQGIQVANDPFVNTIPHFSGNALSFLSAFSIWTGIGALIAGGLAGTLYLCARFEQDDPIYQKAHKSATLFSFLALAAVVITLIWSYAIMPDAAKWTGSGWFGWLVLLIAILISAYKMMSNHAAHHDFAALLWCGAIVVFMWGGMWATNFPYIVPQTWTISQGGNPANDLAILTLFMTGFVPVMITYNIYQIWVFRKRITHLAGYEGH